MKNTGIPLHTFLTLAAIVTTDEEAERLVSAGVVFVNGDVEKDADTTLHHNDEVQVGDQIIIVDATPQEPQSP